MEKWDTEGFLIKLVYPCGPMELDATPRDTLGAGIEQTLERTGVFVT